MSKSKNNLKQIKLSRQDIIEAYIGDRFVKGNSIKVLRNGNEIFNEMFSQIKKSKKTIEFMTYVYWEGEIAKKMSELLIEKAKSGVKVRVIIDYIGRKGCGKLIKNMKNSGIKFIDFRRPHWKIWQWLNRNHKKILICDNEVAFTGGVGIADEWKGDAKNEREWRDTHFKIKGPIIKHLRASFLSDWIEYNDNTNFILENIKDYKKESNVEILFLQGDSSVNKGRIALGFRSLIKSAKNSITICTPYFNPDKRTLNDLCKKAKNRTKVELIIPGEYIDNYLSKVIAQSYYKDLINSGAKIYEYNKTMYHTKAFLVDNNISCIGSVNLNHRSMIKDQEIMLICKSNILNQILREQSKDDLKHSKLITFNDYKKRKLLNKLVVPIVALFKREF